MLKLKTKSGAIRPRKFFWAVGIEDSFIPQEKPGLRSMDEFELTQHYLHWREDLERAAALGIDMIRWGVPWYRVETAPGVFDWTWVDQVVARMRELHIEPIVDIVHYGTPLWLERSFADPQYPQIVERFARAFAQRYRHQIRYYTPANEPAVSAEFSGLKGEWPPYLTGDEGYVKVLLQVALGIQLSARAIREENPEAQLVAVEAMHYYRSESAQAEPAAALWLARDLLCFDLVTGKVDAAHSLCQWLIDHGASKGDLDTLAANPIAYDVFGMNLYPWSLLIVAAAADGNLFGKLRQGSDDGRAMIEVIRRVHSHTQLPIMVTETSAPAYRRATWLNEVCDAVRLARMEGLPLVGLTWFPLFTMIEWDYRCSTKPIDQHLLDLGLVDARFIAGDFVRRNTPLYEAYRALVKTKMPPLSNRRR
jgi:beta-glucosidase/6-phospho-beta-glucosidase/beta-galactosidase